MVNIIDVYTLSFVVLSVFVAAAYIIYIFRKKELLNLIPLVASILTVVLLYRLVGVTGASNYYNLLALDACIALLSTILAIFYISKPYIFIALTVILLAGVTIYITTIGNTIFAGMFGIGTIYGLLYREFVLNPKKEKVGARKKSTETRRDFVQIGLGLILVFLLLSFKYLTATSLIFALIILGYITNNLLANLKLGKIYSRVADLERKNVTYGLGAIYLGASTALMMGFISGMGFASTSNILLFGIIALFFADSGATIIGISSRGATSLPYNRYKTIIGAIAFFVITAALGFFVIGIYAIPFALVLAFIESLNLSLDDNIRIGVVTVILSALV